VSVVKLAEPIVSFARPPVVEVVAGLSFSDAAPEFPVALAAFWKDRLREKFPVLQQQPPYSPPRESFQEIDTFAGISFQLGGQFPTPRLWATTEDGSELIQMQAEWFARNWRKVKPDDEYDRWNSRREALAESYTELIEYLATADFANPAIGQCEVSYINHVDLTDLGLDHGSLARVVKIGETELDSFPVEQVTLELAFAIRDEEPIGRLHFGVKPALNAAGKPIYIIELTARSVPGHYDIDSALSFLDRGRDAINSAFVSLTTAEMHEKWGREQ
jgi:uncharacterized protein (TIGR04255 family)